MDDENWFAGAVRALLPPEKAGLAICIMARLDHERQLRSCERYASGDVKPPATFLRRLLHGDEGWTWFNAVMDGCEAQWWRDVRDAVEIYDTVRRIQSQRSRPS